MIFINLIGISTDLPVEPPVTFTIVSMLCNVPLPPEPYVVPPTTNEPAEDPNFVNKKVLEFNSTDGGQMWTGVDGAISKHGGRGSSGARGQTSVNSTTGNMVVYGPTDYNSIQAQYWTGFWSRELSDDEIVQVFDAHKGRFNI